MGFFSSRKTPALRCIKSPRSTTTSPSRGPATDKLGKTAGKDLDANKPTYVTVLGLAEARRQAHALHQQALDALARSALAGSVHLRMLSDMVVDRDC